MQLILSLLIALAFSAPPTVSAPQQACVIDARAVDAQGSPVAGAQVELRDHTRSLVAARLTDSAGRAHFAVAEGGYYVRAAFGGNCAEIAVNASGEGGVIVFEQPPAPPTPTPTPVPRRSPAPTPMPPAEATIDDGDVRAFVRSLYLNCLRREPDEGGWDFWTQAIMSGAMTREQVEHAICTSPEAQARPSPTPQPRPALTPCTKEQAKRGRCK